MHLCDCAAFSDACMFKISKDLGLSVFIHWDYIVAAVEFPVEILLTNYLSLIYMLVASLIDT